MDPVSPLDMELSTRCLKLLQRLLPDYCSVGRDLPRVQARYLQVCCVLGEGGSG